MLKHVKVTDSVLELRGIYSNLNHHQFCNMYSKKYGVKYKEVDRILRKEGRKHETMAGIL